MDIPTHKLPTRIERADFARSEYFLLAPPGTTPEQVMDPDYWVHLARRLRVNDRIEILAADGSFDMEVRVTGLDPRGLWAHVRPLRLAEGRFAVPEASGAYPDKEGYTVEWGGPHRWRIIRGNDVVARDFADQADAIEALQQIKQAKRPSASAPLIPRMSDPRPPEPEPEPAPVEESPAESEEPTDEPEAAAPRAAGGRFAAKAKAA